MARLNLRSAPVIGKVRDVTSQRMARACQAVVRRVKERLNVTARAARSLGIASRAIGPSLEGESPHRVSGRLVTSITYRVYTTGLDTTVGIVGTKVKYGRRLELGFVGTDSRGRQYHQGPRPYLRPALRESEGEIKRALGGGAHV